MVSSEQLERNIQESSSKVKKDLLSLNDSMSDVQEKIQHLGLNQATLLAEVEKLREEVMIKSKTSKPKTAKKTSKKR